MRLSVSSLTCPDWTLDRMARELVQQHIPAIDLRTLAGRQDIWNLPEFVAAARNHTRKRLGAVGLSVAGVSTSIRAGVERSPNVEVHAAPAWHEECAEALSLCRDMGGSYLRIFGGPRNIVQVDEAAMRSIASDYRRICRAAEPFGIRVLLETHDVVSSGAMVRDIVHRVDHQLAGVVWDVRHPRHLAGESYEETAAALADVLHLVHVKDFDGTNFDLVPFGSGSLDPARLFEVLRSVDYDGDIVLEQPRVAVTGRPMPVENITGFARAFTALLS